MLEMKRKTLAIFTVLLLLAIPISIVNAGETTTKQNKIFSIDLGTILEDGSLFSEKLQLTEQEFFDLEGKLSKIIQKLQKEKNILNFGNIIDRILGKNHPLSYRLKKATNIFKLSHGKAFVASIGNNYKFGNLKKNDFSLRKKFHIWNYNQKGMLGGRTVIFRLLNRDVLNGRQIGFMTGFKGIYLTLSSNSLHKSYTFFMGTATHVRGFDFGGFENPQVEYEI